MSSRLAALISVGLILIASAESSGRDEPSKAASGSSWIADLKSENVETRRAAAARLDAGDRAAKIDALPAFMDRLMNEKDGQVRLAVLDSLIALGPDAAPALPALLHSLRTDYGGNNRLEETHQDYRAAVALSRMGKPAVEGLRGLLKETRENVRAESLMALGRIGPEAAPAAPDLAPLLGDASDRIRREAAIACGRIGALETLLDAAKSDKSARRASAAEGIGHLPKTDEAAGRTLFTLALDSAPEVREVALRALERTPTNAERIRSLAVENLRSPSALVRLATIDLLVSRPEALRTMAPELEALLTSVDDGVARHAADLLGRLGPTATPHLLSAVRDEKSRVEPIAAALAVASRSSDEALTKAALDPQPRVRQASLLALGRLRPVSAQRLELLQGGLRDPDPAVKSAALGAIGELGPRARSAASTVRALLDDASPQVRAVAVTVLARTSTRDEHLAADVIARLDDPDPAVQLRAIDALQPLGGHARPALPILIAKLKSPSSEIRLAAADWIGSQGDGASAAAPALIELLDDPSTDLKTLAVQTLGKLGKAGAPAFDRLVKLLTNQPPKLREAAVATIGGLGLSVETARPALALALRDEQPEVRAAAAAAIPRFGPEGSLFLPDLIIAAAPEGRAPAFSRGLRRFERRGPDPRSIPELIALLDHPSPSVRSLAAKFLGLATPAPVSARAPLEKLRKDPDADVRKQAEAALAKIPEPKKAE